jgi:hypothetical protein
MRHDNIERLVLVRHVFRASCVRHVDIKYVAVFSGIPFLSVSLHCCGSPSRHVFFYLGGSVSDPLLPRSFPGLPPRHLPFSFPSVFASVVSKTAQTGPQQGAVFLVTWRTGRWPDHYAATESRYRRIFHD